MGAALVNLWLLLVRRGMGEEEEAEDEEEEDFGGLGGLTIA